MHDNVLNLHMIFVRNVNIKLIFIYQYDKININTAYFGDQGRISSIIDCAAERRRCMS